MSGTQLTQRTHTPSHLISTSIFNDCSTCLYPESTPRMNDAPQLPGVLIWTSLSLSVAAYLKVCYHSMGHFQCLYCRLYDADKFCFMHIFICCSMSCRIYCHSCTTTFSDISSYFLLQSEVCTGICRLFFFLTLLEEADASA